MAVIIEVNINQNVFILKELVLTIYITYLKKVRARANVPHASLFKDSKYSSEVALLAILIPDCADGLRPILCLRRAWCMRKGSYVCFQPHFAGILLILIHIL